MNQCMSLQALRDLTLWYSLTDEILWAMPAAEPGRRNVLLSVRE